MAKTKDREKPADDFAKFAPKDELIPDDGVPTEVINSEAAQRLAEGKALYDATRRPTVEEVAEMAKNQPQVEVPAQHPQGGGRAPDYIGAFSMSYLSGRELPPIVPKEGADPLLVKMYRQLRSLVAGGLISPFAGGVIEDLNTLLGELKQAVEGT